VVYSPLNLGGGDGLRREGGLDSNTTRI